MLIKFGEIKECYKGLCCSCLNNEYILILSGKSVKRIVYQPVVDLLQIIQVGLLCM